MGAFNKDYVHFMRDEELYGRYGYFADSIDNLVERVNTGYQMYRGRLSIEISNNCSFPFVNEDDGCNYKFFYSEPSWVDDIVIRSRRATNRELALWLSQGNGLLLDEKLGYIRTNHSFLICETDSVVLDKYRVMPIDGSEWIEPTVDVVCVQ